MRRVLRVVVDDRHLPHPHDARIAVLFLELRRLIKERAYARSARSHRDRRHSPERVEAQKRGIARARVSA